MLRNINNNPVSGYLEKQNKSASFFEDVPLNDLELIVVIPAYKEENIQETISSLYQCMDINGSVEIIVFVNGNEFDDAETIETNLKSLEILHDLQNKFSTPKRKLLYFHSLDTPSKKAGVGLARKTLMDEACFRFNSINRDDGIISNLDADCIVDQNYFLVLQKFFKENPNFTAASIHYEHRYLDPLLKEAIINYELHLRYFIGMQRLISLSFAFHTIGSSMACKVDEYAKVGGMNTRKAGEDFYFLHKFIKNEKCGRISETTIRPSDRISDRVPFGTGKAVGDKVDGKENLTYHPDSFLILEKFLSFLPTYFELGWSQEAQKSQVPIETFFDSIKFGEKVSEIKRNTKTYASFEKRFYQFFDAFQLMKYLHFMRSYGYEDIKVEVALKFYFERINLKFSRSMEENLNTLRNFDKLNLIPQE